MNNGRSIRLFLADGTPSGIITAEIMNWTGHVMFAPRSRLADLLKRQEAKRTGVYFLTGSDTEGSLRPLVYVGETDNVANRINQHSKDQNKDFWDRVCFITSKDQNLTKAHAKYLESRLISIVAEAGRARLSNNKEPEYNLLPEADKADMEYFIEQIKMVLPVIGLDFLREHAQKQNDVVQKKDETLHRSPMFELHSKKHDIHALAQEVDGEFVVAIGSYAQKEWIGAASGYQTLRQQLIDEKFLVLEEKKNKLVFDAFYSFKSPSAAATVILGRPSNGRIEWFVKDTKKTYAEWQDEQVAAVAPTGAEE